MSEPTATLSTESTVSPGVESSPAPSFHEAAEQAFAQQQPPAQPSASETPAQPSAAASGSETPAAPERGPIPYDRFQEVNEARRRAEEQLSQFQTVSDFLPLVQELQRSGLSPAEVQGFLLGQQQALGQQPFGAQAPFGQPSVPGPGSPAPAPAAAPDPQQAFAQSLAAQGLDPAAVYEQNPAGYALAFQQFQQASELRSMLDGFRAQQEQAQVQAIQQSLTTQMERVSQQYPIFQNPTFQQALYAQVAASLEAGLPPTPTALQTVAERFHNELQAHVTGELARYSVAKAEDARVPVVTGGAAPPPVESRNFHQLGEQDQRAALESFLATQAGGI